MMLRPTLEEEYKMALEADADEIERLRAALRGVIEITKRNSDVEIILMAIRMCASDALEEKK